MNDKVKQIEKLAKEKCEHFDDEVCSKLDCKKDCKYYGKANCYNCIHEEICQLRTFSYREEEVKEKGCEHYQQKFFENSVVVSKKEIKIYQEIYDFMKEKGLVSVGEMKTLISFVLKGSMLKTHIIKETAEKYHKAMRKVIHERDYIEGYAEIGLQEENDEIAKQLGVEIKE